MGQGILERGGWVNKKGAFRCQLSNIATNHLGTNQRWNYLEDSRISSRIILELIHYVPAGGGSSSHDNISGVQKLHGYGSNMWCQGTLLERSFLRLETISWLTSTMFSWLDLFSLVFQMLSATWALRPVGVSKGECRECPLQPTAVKQELLCHGCLSLQKCWYHQCCKWSMGRLVWGL